MAEIVADCPRCGAKRITFGLEYEVKVCEHNNVRFFEAFCVCRNCNRTTVFEIVAKKGVNAGAIENRGIYHLNESVNNYYDIIRHISIKDNSEINPPEYLPQPVEEVYREGATCVLVGCYNASAAMFRLCIDLATKSLLPDKDINGLTAKIRRNLGLRLPWLFENNILPEALEDLSTCIKDDGNDGVHDGTLSKEDAEDLQDFTYTLLERLYTEPNKLILAKARREERRAKASEE